MSERADEDKISDVVAEMMIAFLPWACSEGYDVSCRAEDKGKFVSSKTNTALDGFVGGWAAAMVAARRPA